MNNIIALQRQFLEKIDENVARTYIEIGGSSLEEIETIAAVTDKTFLFSLESTIKKAIEELTNSNIEILQNLNPDKFPEDFLMLKIDLFDQTHKAMFPDEYKDGEFSLYILNGFRENILKNVPLLFIRSEEPKEGKKICTLLKALGYRSFYWQQFSEDNIDENKVWILGIPDVLGVKHDLVDSHISGHPNDYTITH